jgi:hypothetical protein
MIGSASHNIREIGRRMITIEQTISPTIMTIDLINIPKILIIVFTMKVKK